MKEKIIRFPLRCLFHFAVQFLDLLVQSAECLPIQVEKEEVAVWDRAVELIPQQAGIKW